MSLTTTLKPTHLALAVQTAIESGLSPMVHGDPGIGKSDIMFQVACSMFAPAYDMTWDGVQLRNVAGATVAKVSAPFFKDVRSALLDPVDLRGLPTIEEVSMLKGKAVKQTQRKTTWAIPDFLPTDPRGGIVFLDEINRGSEMVQNALFSFALDGTIGDYQKPATWSVTAAVNDSDIGARKMPAALQARFLHLDAVTDLQDVCDFAVRSDWAPVVYAFLRFKPAALHLFSPKERVSPNPRSWAFVSQLVNKGLPASVELSMLKGLVGEGLAIEFAAFLRMFRNLAGMSPDSIVLNPDTAPLPAADQPSIMFAVSAALGRFATDTNISRIITYLERMPVEYNVRAIRDAERRNPALAAVGSVTKWKIKHSDVTM